MGEIKNGRRSEMMDRDTERWSAVENEKLR